MHSISQKTINSKISCNSVGIHSGKKVTMTLIPAPCDSGITFRRTDVEAKKSEVKATYDNVVETNLGTTIANEFGTKILTIEHLMAAIWGCGIDNLIVELDAPEIPIMDGSSEPFVFLIECAGINIQSEPRRVIEVLKKIRVEDGDKFVEVEPARDFSANLTIEFPHPVIGQQKFEFHSNSNSFKNDICRARTFGFKKEIDQLHKMGLALGGSLDNAILVDDAGIVNQGKLRYDDEFVRHKILDFFGDIYLAKHQIIGHFNAFKTGHALNNKVLRQLMKDETAWRLV